MCCQNSYPKNYIKASATVHIKVVFWKIIWIYFNIYSIICTVTPINHCVAYLHSFTSLECCRLVSVYRYQMGTGYVWGKMILNSCKQFFRKKEIKEYKFYSTVSFAQQLHSAKIRLFHSLAVVMRKSPFLLHGIFH